MREVLLLFVAVVIALGAFAGVQFANDTLESHIVQREKIAHRKGFAEAKKKGEDQCVEILRGMLKSCQPTRKPGFSTRGY